MKKIITAIISLTLVNSAIADTTLIHNVKGYTIKNGELSQFNAIQFTDDSIDRVFSKNTALPNSKDIRQIDGKGATMLPGLIDAHGHVLNYGLSLQRVDLVGSTSEKDAISRVVDYQKENPEQKWIQGRGWNQVQWPSNQFPTAKSLDKYFPDTPVFLSRVDGHAGWANSKAMEIAGITKQTLSPNGGEIIKDASGAPNGVFVDNAMDLIFSKIPALSRNEQKNVLIKAMNKLASVGLTSVHDAGVTSENIEIFNEIANEQAMPIRINAMLYLPSDNWQQRLKQGQIKSADGTFAFNSVKIQADGALGSRGAAMHADYSDKTNHKGLLLHTNEKLSYYIEQSMKAGFQVNTHAIGDHANSLTLDQYEQHIASTNSKALRHRIEHAQVLRVEDIPRFKSLNVIASIQATHATSDKNMAEDRIGKKRLKGAYAWRSLLNAGAKIANGSDFPVEPTNPFYGLHASITRQDRHNQPLGGWISSEKLSHEETLKSFTIDAAYAGHQEDIVGTLEPAKKADFILVDADMFTQEPSTIWQNKVLATWVNGKQVFSRY
ncbi:amidohydrolase [Thalassotalea atypica]|uniref:amidohydrolase n=1 Tax=Thalassotalea atypica TaxID=2054316 RepID=UPI0025740B92|nr:amidohydrolase [Thalassotalea atypica]